MRILLIGEYSNVHWTLSEGLRMLGHDVDVLSNGDFWKNYPRNIDLSRTSYTTLGGVSYALRLLRLLPRLKGYDVVQLINPMFLELKASNILPVYKYLRRHNGKIVLGAFGMDYYWVKSCIEEMPLRYSDFNLGKQLRTNAEAIAERNDWLGTDKEKLNRRIAEDADGIVAGLYEYWVCYHPKFPEKTTFIPYPIKPQPNISQEELYREHVPIRLFIGINKSRSQYKGTDIMLEAAKQVCDKYPQRLKLTVAENVPFGQYTKMMNSSDVILDQLYSYTPSMNPLQAMSQGMVCVGGGEPENYEIIHEDVLRPILNVEPTFQSVYDTLENLVFHPEILPKLKRQSIQYIQKHHDYIKVAKQYESFYERL
ncbi:MAG: glycosyltransferase family 1 protein [Prevotella sp.]|nr:glycosyltransferase family 1 protein [Prevotella sp.]